MPTTPGEQDGADELTPVDPPSQRLHTVELDHLVDAALAERRRPRPPVPDPYLGVEVDRRYRIEALIAAGGMGLVYRCRHRVLGKKLAIKIIRADVAHMPDGSERFLLEAKAASSVGNEHIVDIVDFGAMPDGSPYLVMEYLEGVSLAALFKSQAELGVARIARIASQIAEGLGAAHAAGIVHRDLKPDNVFVLQRKGEDFIKILDFGVARMAESAKKLTQAGTIVGTPHYMPPEQALGQEVDHRGDIYALGVILYELLTRRVPFDGEHYVSVLHQHLQATPPPFAALDPPIHLPTELEDIVLKCLAKAPRDRHATMAELARALAPFGGVGLAALGPAGEGEELPLAMSLSSLPAPPPPLLARVPLGADTARMPAPILDAVFDAPSGASHPLQHPALPPASPTVVLPRLTGSFTMQHKRALTTTSVIVLVGACALVAFRFGTAQGRKAAVPPEVLAPAASEASRPAAGALGRELMPPRDRTARPDPAAPGAAEIHRETPAVAPAPTADELPVEPATGPEAVAGATPARPAEPTVAKPETHPSPAGDGAKAPATVAGASREPSEASKKAPAAASSPKRSTAARPASKPRSRNEFMNPWPAPR